MNTFRDLKVYQLAFEQADEIFTLSVNFPREEIYSLTSQIKRSSRSVCANLAEAFRKRRYPAHFTLKLSDADAENTETSVWIDFASVHKYMSPDKTQKLIQRNDEIGRLLGYMLSHPEKFIK
jgi:four helix bundle protein